jgi:hypothetical protein
MDLVLDKKTDGKYLKNMNAYFSDNNEVMKVIETLNKNWLQIKLRDQIDGIITVMTWDFDNNME